MPQFTESMRAETAMLMQRVVDRIEHDELVELLALVDL